jgi:hypothetical protein
MDQLGELNFSSPVISAEYPAGFVPLQFPGLGGCSNLTIGAGGRGLFGTDEAGGGGGGGGIGLQPNGVNQDCDSLNGKGFVPGTELEAVHRDWSGASGSGLFGGGCGTVRNEINGGAGQSYGIFGFGAGGDAGSETEPSKNGQGGYVRITF